MKAETMCCSPKYVGHRSISQGCRLEGSAGASHPTSSSEQGELQVGTKWLCAFSRPVLNISKKDFHPRCENIFPSPPAVFSLATTCAGCLWILLRMCTSEKRLALPL